MLVVAVVVSMIAIRVRGGKSRVLCPTVRVQAQYMKSTMPQRGSEAKGTQQ